LLLKALFMAPRLLENFTPLGPVQLSSTAAPFCCPPTYSSSDNVRDNSFKQNQTNVGQFVDSDKHLVSDAIAIPGCNASMLMKRSPLRDNLGSTASTTNPAKFQSLQMRRVKNTDPDVARPGSVGLSISCRLQRKLSACRPGDLGKNGIERCNQIYMTTTPEAGQYLYMVGSKYSFLPSML
jgi:hypothetical protein